MIRFALILLMSLAVSSQAVAKKTTFSDKDGKIIEFSSYMGSDLWGSKGDKIQAHGILYMPEKASPSNPVPLAIIIPGLGGQRGRDNRICQMLSENGIACFGVRTYASRNAPHRAKSSEKFRVGGAGSRFHDAYGALEKLANEPNIDPNNIWHIGFSLGGFNSALALDPALTAPFQLSELDFAGFISLYGPCVLTSSEKLKPTKFYSFIGTADAGYNEDECNAFITSLKVRGVEAAITVFEGSQFKRIGHMWDYMQSATGDWHGKPEGPWKLGQDYRNWPMRGVTLMGCEFLVRPALKEISANKEKMANLDDNEAWEFLMKSCGTAESVRTTNHKVTKSVDKEIVSIISTYDK